MIIYMHPEFKSETISIYCCLQFKNERLKRQEELSLWSWLNNRSEGDSI